MRTSTKFKVFNLFHHVCIGTVLVVGHDYATELGVGILVAVYAQIVGVNAGLHRYFAHRSYKTSPAKERVLLWSSVLTGVGSPGIWCPVHRMHHAHSDTELDPHCPLRDGPLNTWFTNWKPVPLGKRYFKKLNTTPDMRFLNRHYFKVVAALWLALAAVEPLWAVFWVSLPAVYCLHATVSVAVLPHYMGVRKYETRDSSRNSILCSLLSLGEGWHNTHHAYPGRWNTSERWWELDPPAWIIRWIQV